MFLSLLWRCWSYGRTYFAILEGSYSAIPFLINLLLSILWFVTVLRGVFPHTELAYIEKKLWYRAILPNSILLHYVFNSLLKIWIITSKINNLISSQYLLQLHFFLILLHFPESIKLWWITMIWKISYFMTDFGRNGLMASMFRITYAAFYYIILPYLQLIFLQQWMWNWIELLVPKLLGTFKYRY